jgi:hypothetical protein
LVLSVTIGAGCLNAVPPNGAARCGPAPNVCPTGYYCAGDNRCWRTNQGPDLATAGDLASSPGDLASKPGDLASSPGDLASNPDLASTSTCGAGCPIVKVQSNAATNASTLAFPQPVGSHNLLVVCVNITSATVQQITDSVGNTFVLLPAGSTPFGPQVIGYAANSRPGADTITITPFGTPTFIEVFILEYSGLQPSNPFDASASASGTSAMMDSGPAMTTGSHDLILGFAIAGPSISLGSGFTMQETISGDVVEGELVLSSGSYRATAALGASGDWGMMMAAFKGM